MRKWHVVKSILGLFAAAGKSWSSDNMSSMAASLAFQALLSLAPLLLVMVAVFRLVLANDVVEGQILEQVNMSLGPQVVEGVRIVLQNAVKESPSSIAIGSGTIAMLIVFSAGFFRELIHALNVAWKAGEKDARIMSGVVRLLRGHALAFVMVILMVLYLYASVVLKAIAIIPEQALLHAFPWIAALLPKLPLFVVPAVLFLLLVILFTVLPARRISWRDAWCGALLTTVLFIPSYRLIQIYLARNAVTSYYGAAGSFIAILLWIYFSAMIFLFGAEFARVYAERYGSLRRV